jgi:AraC family transcriptional regulator
MKEEAKVAGLVHCSGTPDFLVRLIEYPRELWQPIHTHDRGSVTLVLAGAIEEKSSGRTEFALPFSLIIKKPRLPHTDRFGPSGCTTLQINLPEEFDLGDCDLQSDAVVWHNEGGRTIGPILRLLSYMKAGVAVSSHDISFALYEALEALPSRSIDSHMPPLWVLEVKDLIDSSDPMRPLSMARLKEQVGIHPVHLTRQFKRHFGVTVREYMQYRRVRAAAGYVAESCLSLTEVAHSCGFADQAHFCRAFRSIAKLNASDYRALTRAEPSLKVANLQFAGPSDPSFLRRV